MGGKISVGKKKLGGKNSGDQTVAATHYYLSINENHVYALVSGVYFLCPSHQSSRHQGEYMLVIIVVVLVFSYKP